MANEDIKSMIRDINHDISELQNQIRAIEMELNTISNCAQSNHSKLLASATFASQSMENNSNALVYANNTLCNTYDTQLQVKELLFIFKDIETANKKIRALSNKLYFEFKNQSKVRKIVLGFIDNLNLEMVSSEKLYTVIEKSHLQTPDFWLTYVLIAIMAWKENDKDKVERAIEGAMDLNAKSTVLFMMYFNLLLNRIEAGLKWFDLYKKMEKVGTDSKTLLMLICSLTSRIDNVNDSNDEVSKNILEYLDKEISNDRQLVDEEEFVSSIEKFFVSMKQTVSYNYEYFRKYVSDFQMNAAALTLAANNDTILDYFTEVSHIIKDEKNLFLDSYIQEIIHEPSEGEKEIRDEIEYNEEIIKCVNLVKQSKGVVTTSDFKQIAKDNYDKKKLHDESQLNSAFEIFNWIYGSSRKEKIPTLAKWNLFILNKKYTYEAYENYKTSYRNLLKSNYKVTINDFNLETSFEDLNKDILLTSSFSENKKKYLLKKQKKPMFYIGIVLAILCLVIFLLGVTKVIESNITLLGIVGTAIFAIISGISLIVNIAKKKKISARMAYEKQKNIEIVNQLYEEKKNFDVEFAKYDEVAKEVDAFLEKVSYGD